MMIRVLLSFVALFCMSFVCSAQTFSMSNRCSRQLSQADSLIKYGDNASAIAAFEGFIGSCKTKDAKIKGNGGYAMALNVANRFEEAIGAAAISLRSSKNSNIVAWYATAVAQSGLGNVAAAKESFSKVADLTKRNRNTQERARIFAELAELDARQGKFADAHASIDAALAIDTGNANFYVKKGDFFVGERNYDAAFEQYDKAILAGNKSAALYQVRSEARLKQFQNKYNTKKANELIKLINASDAQILCDALRIGVANGVKSMQLELVASMLCK